MNITEILKQIEKTDPKVFEQQSDRRNALKSFGSKVAVVALPLLAGSMFKKTYAQTTGDAVIDTLNFALELKYMQYNFYRTGNSTGGLIPTADQAGFATIENQERNNIIYLRNALTSLGAILFTPNHYDATALNPLFVPRAYDFTATGTYATFDNYNIFLQVAQTIEDLCVHAFKGLLPAVYNNAPTLGGLLQMHCTDARHAAHVRLIRRFTGAPEYPSPWINNNIPPTIPLQPYYIGEDNTMQLGVEILELPDTFDESGFVPKISATAAFDEPMELETVKLRIAPFLLP
jgi:hypothetical protein